MLTPTRKRRAPAKEVFKVPELVENILIYLPCRDLLFSQRVCRTWRKVVQSATKLQQILFLRPIGPSLKSFGNYAAKGTAPAPRNIEQVKVIENRFRWSTSKTSQIATTIVENPLLNHLFPLLKDENVYSFADHAVSRKLLDYEEIPLYDPHISPAPLLFNPNTVVPSWKFMLLSQPPVSEIYQSCTGKYIRINYREDLHTYARVEVPGLAAESHEQERIFRSTGLVMGDLVWQTWKTLPGDKNPNRPTFSDADVLSPVVRLYLRDIWTWLKVVELSAVDLENLVEEYEWKKRGWMLYEEKRDKGKGKVKVGDDDALVLNQGRNVAFGAGLDAWFGNKAERRAKGAQW